MQECAKIEADILYVSVQEDALAKIVGSQVSANDVAVFAGGTLVTLVSRRGWQLDKDVAFFVLLLEMATKQELGQDEESFTQLVRSAVQQAATFIAGKSQSSGQRKKQSPIESRDPYEILGVARGVSASELKEARARLLNIAHSDRVEGLHPAIRELATELTRNIIWAYETLKKQAAA